MPQFALRVVTGSDAGREFNLTEGRELVIGRLSTADVTVEDDNVSRRHVGITVVHDQISLHDLGSRNGTFVNRQRVTQATLRPGDLVSIGNCVLRIVKLAQTFTPPPARPSAAKEAPPQSKPLAQTSSLAPPPVHGNFRGSLTEIGLMDVLQLLSTTRKSGLLLVRCGKETGRIFIQEGRVYYACMEEWVEVDPRKVLYRLLRWASGAFELEKSDVRVFDNPITESTDALLLEGARQLDELNHLGAELPPLTASVSVVSPLPGRLAEMEDHDLDFLQLVLDYQTVRRILDHFCGTDFEAYTRLLGLAGRNFLKVTAHAAVQHPPAINHQHG
jgi:pSer/pThr/pTyr-binding forkhead associated (FHA) protein